MKKRGSILIEKVLFIILNLVFLTILILFLSKQGAGATVLEKTYSKQIALMLDASKPGTILKLNLNELKEVSDKKGIAFEDVVKINENLVIVKLSDKGGSTYSFFNDIEVIAFSDEEYYIFTVDLKQANE